MNINQVTIVGRLTRDPEKKALPNGTSVVNASVATSRTWKDKNGQKQEDAEFHNVVAFGNTADIMAQYLKKGQLVGIMGRLQTRSWDDKDSGKKMYRTEIVVEQMQMGPKAGNAGGDTRSQADKDFDSYGKDEAPAAEGEGKDPINPDDIPF